MALPVAEIASLHSTLEHLVARLGTIARDHEQEAKGNPSSAELLAIEGQLTTARRRLEKMLRRL
jgi:hypothetical protein